VATPGEDRLSPPAVEEYRFEEREAQYLIGARLQCGPAEYAFRRMPHEVQRPIQMIDERGNCAGIVLRSPNALQRVRFAIAHP
jgi:hypothetical protein